MTYFFWLSGVLYSLIEMFVPHKISLFLFLFHWYTGYDSNYIEFQPGTFLEKKTYFVDILLLLLLLLFPLFCSCPSLSCLCFTEHICTWNGIQPMHMLIITRKMSVSNPTTNQKICKKSFIDGDRKRERKESREKMMIIYIEMCIYIWSTHVVTPHFSCKTMRWVCVYGQL